MFDPTRILILHVLLTNSINEKTNTADYNPNIYISCLLESSFLSPDPNVFCLWLSASHEISSWTQIKAI